MSSLSFDHELPSTRCDKGSVTIVNYNSLEDDLACNRSIMSEVLKGNLTRSFRSSTVATSVGMLDAELQSSVFWLELKATTCGRKHQRLRGHRIDHFGSGVRRV